MISNSILNNHRKVYFFFSLVALFAGILFYMQDQFYVPSLDDYNYKFILNDVNQAWTSNLTATGAGSVPISSLGDAIRSQWYCYFHSDGRFLVHTVVQLLTSFVPSSTYIVLNSFFYALLIFLLLYLTCPLTRSLKNTVLCVIVAALFLPFQGLDFLGAIAHNVNYLWTGVCVLASLVIVESQARKDNKASALCHWGFLLLGLLIGSLQESYSIGYAGALLVYAIYKRCVINRTTVFHIIGVCLGMILCVLSPGNILRATESSGTFHLQWNFFLGMCANPTLWFFIVVFAIAVVKKQKETLIFLKDNIILWLTCIFNSLFCLVIAYNGRHQLMCISLFLLILSLRLFFQICKTEERAKKFILAVFIPLFCLGYGFVYHYRKCYAERYYAVLSDVKNHREVFSHMRQYDDLVYKIEHTPLLNNYYLATYDFIRHRGIGKVTSLALTQGQDMDRFAHLLPDTPKQIVNACSNANKVDEQTYKIFNGYYVRTDTSTVESNLKVENSRSLFSLGPTTVSLPLIDTFVYKGKRYALY